jgi:hypothetical protein
VAAVVKRWREIIGELEGGRGGMGGMGGMGGRPCYYC